MTDQFTELRGSQNPSNRRTESESSSSSDIDIFPLGGLEDITFNSNNSGYISSSEEEFEYAPTEPGRFFSLANHVNTKLRKKSESREQRNWRHALRLIKDVEDPWEQFGLESKMTEKGIRHRYNPISMEWVQDECVLKMEKIPFAHGAMRECFRMKKLSNFSQNNDWLRDSNNYVAKSYMASETERDSYFQDVKLQMDAKLWGEEFNRHNPPKKVDIFMMAVLEMPERPGKPLFHIEHFIDGEYVKYNSNSGFVDYGSCRQTPQAFSHFTFERSGHELMVVDVQGVGDLYTDPQIHTASGDEYGDGNLGTKGMALFFHSHKCNRICQSLGLTEFDLSRNELEALVPEKRKSKVSETRVRLDEIVLCESTPDHKKTDFRKFFRQRSVSHGFVDYDRLQLERSNSHTSDWSSNSSLHNSEDCVATIESEDQEGVHDIERHRVPQKGDTETSTDSGVIMPEKRLQRLMTVDCFKEWNREQGDDLRARIEGQSRPSCISAEIENLKDEGDESNSILAQIHLDLAKYHETCRFNVDKLDIESALIHLKAGADCGNLQALIALSQLYSGLPNDILPALTTEEIKPFVQGIKMVDIGLDYMTTAARLGDLRSVLYLAEAFHTGLNLGTDRNASIEEALKWYELALKLGAEQPYLLQAKLAEIYLKGGQGVPRNPLRSGELYTEAAESAMEDMKGKLANKYYMLAEEAWAECED